MDKVSGKDCNSKEKLVKIIKSDNGLLLNSWMERERGEAKVQ